MAETEGIENPRVEQAGIHARLLGEVRGTPISLIVSLTKCFASPRITKNVRGDMRRIVRDPEKWRHGVR